MEGTKVVEALFAQFGEAEFMTRNIPPDVMDKLAELIGIDGKGPGRNIKVGQYISDSRGLQYTLESGQQVKITVTRPEKSRRPLRFRLADATSMPPKHPYKVTAVEDPETILTYDVLLVESEDSWAALCPALPGCVSQGESEADALENIREAMTGWLKGEARDVELNILNLLDEYNEAGYPAKRAKVSVARIKADASIH